MGPLILLQDINVSLFNMNLSGKKKKMAPMIFFFLQTEDHVDYFILTLVR